MRCGFAGRRSPGGRNSLPSQSPAPPDPSRRPDTSGVLGLARDAWTASTRINGLTSSVGSAAGARSLRLGVSAA